jgi:hypothetical protein
MDQQMAAAATHQTQSTQVYAATVWLQIEKYGSLPNTVVVKVHKQ